MVCCPPLKGYIHGLCGGNAEATRWLIDNRRVRAWRDRVRGMIDTASIFSLGRGMVRTTGPKCERQEREVSCTTSTSPQLQDGGG